MFEIETTGYCRAMMKRRGEITEEEASKKKYKDGRIQVVNYEANTTEYVYAIFSHSQSFLLFLFYRNGWLCEYANVNSTANFDYGHPPIIIVTLKPLRKRNEEGYKPKSVKLRDMKTIIRISSVK